MLKEAANAVFSGLHVMIDTQLPLDGRSELTGQISRPDDAETDTSAELPTRLAVIFADGGTPVLVVPVEVSGDFAIPLGELAPGYYRVVPVTDTGEEIGPEIQPLFFAVPGLREASTPAVKSSSWLDFVVHTMDLLLEHQSCRFGGSPQAPSALTVTTPLSRSYLSLGHRENGEYRTYWFPETRLLIDPVMLDFELWPILQQLAAITGRDEYGQLLAGMAEQFAVHGFDAESGLGFLGEEAGFDVLHLRGVATKVNNAQPIFKPKNSGHFSGMPLDVLWQHAPEKMHRMFRSMFYGLITDPKSMDYNRFCSYDYRDTDRPHLMERNPGHCAFESAAGRMIHWWASCYRHTGDGDCLDWAERMLSKWEAVQHPQTGLVPNFFGARAWDPGASMPPGEWAELRGVGLMAVALMEAAGELEQSGSAGELVDRLRMMAEKLALGIARHGYDAPHRLFHEWLHLDGRVYETTARYVFRTQEEKEAAVRENPAMERVRVYRGAGLYRNQPYWDFCAGTRIPLQLAQVAEQTGNREIVELLATVAKDALAESRMQPDEFTDEGGFTFRAGGIYIKVCLSLLRQTGDTFYFSAARELAALELERLGRVQAPDWWRMPERVALLDALLELHTTTKTHSIQGEAVQ